jgi:hypothetical protein
MACDFKNVIFVNSFLSGETHDNLKEYGMDHKQKQCDVSESKINKKLDI